jgi:hypothetical protein
VKNVLTGAAGSARRREVAAGEAAAFVGSVDEPVAALGGVGGDGQRAKFVAS